MFRFGAGFEKIMGSLYVRRVGHASRILADAEA